jgi:hypothetical protein
MFDKFMDGVLPVICAIAVMVIALHFGVSVTWAALLAFPLAFIARDVVGWILALTLVLTHKFQQENF